LQPAKVPTPHFIGLFSITILLLLYILFIDILFIDILFLGTNY